MINIVHVDDVFQLRHWPVKYPAAQEALHNMDSTHRVNPMAAYDIHGSLIPPTQYASVLTGAVVRASVTMSHWHIAKDSRDTYTADVLSLRVIVPAPVLAPKVTPSSSTSPRKRRNAPIASKDLGPSPMKKPRGD
jgi:hypothetical protein